MNFLASALNTFETWMFLPSIYTCHLGLHALSQKFVKSQIGKGELEECARDVFFAFGVNENVHDNLKECGYFGLYSQSLDPTDRRKHSIVRIFKDVVHFP